MITKAKVVRNYIEKQSDLIDDMVNDKRLSLLEIIAIMRLLKDVIDEKWNLIKKIRDKEGQK